MFYCKQTVNENKSYWHVTRLLKMRLGVAPKNSFLRLNRYFKFGRKGIRPKKIEIVFDPENKSGPCKSEINSSFKWIRGMHT